MAVLCHSAASSLHAMMNETMLMDGPLMKDDPFYLDSTHWSCGGGGGGGGAGRFRDDPVKSYTMLTRQVCNTALFSSTQFHAAQMTLNNSKMSELDSDDVSLDSWQKTHPEQWTCEDVLNLIYFIALKSNNIEFASLHGEKFQNVAGAELCSMTEKDFVLKDSQYGKMLYQCVRTLLEKSQFLPPEDIVFVKKEKSDCLSSIHSEIPRPVEELSFEDELFDDEKQNVISMFGINYDIDSAADFGNIQSTTDVIPPSSSSSTSTSVSSSSSSSSLSSGVCTDTTCMDVDQRTEAEPTYDDNYAYHLNLYPSYHNTHHHHQPQHQSQQQHHEHSLVPDSTVCGGGVPFPIDLRRNHEADSGTAGDILWPQSERKMKRLRNKSISSDGEGSSSSCSQSYHDANRQPNNVGKNHLWEFLCQLLRMSESVQAKDRVIQWESREEGVFRIIDSKEVASLWGKHKGNEKMTYEKLSRALRWCRTFGFLAALPKDGKFPKKLCFRFGPRATNWRHFV